MNDDDDDSFIEMLGNDAFYKLVFWWAKPGVKPLGPLLFLSGRTVLIFMTEVFISK